MYTVYKVVIRTNNGVRRTQIIATSIGQAINDAVRLYKGGTVLQVGYMLNGVYKRLIPLLSLIAVLTCALPASSEARVHHPKVDLDPIFIKESKQNKIGLKLLRAVCFTESALNQKVRLVMDNGTPSYGICQVKMATAEFHGFKGTAAELIEPKTNVHYCAKILAYWMKKLKGDWRKAVTAYNRGHFTKKMSPYNRYVVKIMFAMHEGK